MAVGDSRPGFLVVDGGSSRTRVTLIGVDGQRIASASGAPPSRISGSTAVLAADQLWAQVVSLVRQLDLEGKDVVAIGVAAQLGVVLVDQHGRACADALLWPDRRAADMTSPLATRLGARAATIGRAIVAEMPACKAMWWSEHEPAALARSRWLLSIKDYLVMRMTRQARTDETHASYTGWFDVSARAYATDLVESSGVRPELLPPVASAAEVAGALTGQAAAELGLPAGITVSVGCPDGTAGALGAGATRPRATVDVAGTTDVLLSVVDTPRRDDAGHAVVNAYVADGLWVVGGPTGMTGGAVEWLSRILGYESAAQAFSMLGDAALAIPIGAEGISFDPALSGSRFAGWQSAERGLLYGLQPHHTPAHVLRAVHEGAAFVVDEGIAALEAAGMAVSEVVMVGGVAGVRPLVQLRSDLWGIPVRVFTGDVEATALGTAMLAAVAAGVFADLTESAKALLPPSELVLPAPEAADAGAAARTQWRAAVRFARGQP